jgi:sporulation protein YlmC with PRC-barrel domain
MFTRLVKGTAVVSLDDGAKLGKIDHVYLDPARKEVVGFSFQSGGGLLGGRTSHMVDIADVHGIGQDAVTLNDAAVVKSELAVAHRRDDLIDLEDLLKRKVITESGTVVGQVAAIEFGSDTFRLTEIKVSPGFFKTEAMIQADEIERIGDELIVVAVAVCGATVEPALLTVA